MSNCGLLEGFDFAVLFVTQILVQFLLSARGSDSWAKTFRLTGRAIKLTCKTWILVDPLIL